MSWELSNFVQSLTSVSDSTASVYKRDLKSFIKWCESQRLTAPSEVSRRNLRYYLAWLQENDYSRNTISRKVSSLRRYFKWAQHNSLTASNPTISLQTQGGKSQLPRVLKKLELQVLLLKSIVRKSVEVKLLISMMTLSWSGCRSDGTPSSLARGTLVRRTGAAAL